MTKILVTGSTSMQSNPQAHRRSANFFGVLVDFLRQESGGEVHWDEPRIYQSAADFAQYEYVVVGLAPPQSLGANRLYGALSAVSALWGSKKLILVLDQPDLGALARGLRAADARWSTFTKPFFAYRKDYEAAATDRMVNSKLRMAVQHLLHDQWPATLVPATPWADVRPMTLDLPKGAEGALVPMLLDRVRMAKPLSYMGPLTTEPEYWAFEKGCSYKWLMEQTVSMPRRELESNHRREMEAVNKTELAAAHGFMHGPVDGRWWWSPKIGAALLVGCPVFTDWHTAREVCPSFDVLPGSIEGRGRAMATELARAQLDDYYLNLPTSDVLYDGLTASVALRHEATMKMTTKGAP